MPAYTTTFAAPFAREDDDAARFRGRGALNGSVLKGPKVALRSAFLPRKESRGGAAAAAAAAAVGANVYCNNNNIQ